ncbi:hypothetical protein PInf_017271 [Phytophthora infestans]|nr:hypothetical protein PInf_017229 [Phytophthora infestans]KAI9991891.1 hypothetical protein PInf_017271 [Phytophthora infestans]
MSAFNSRQAAKSFQAIETNDGAGAHIRRSIGSPVLYNFDPFLILDEFHVGLPGGFPDHPHRGFETVTYVFPTSKGGMRHEDFIGNKGELRPGDLQWMTPGRGIMHAEMPSSTEPAHGLQLWVNLPKERKMITPRYQEISRESVPHAFNADKSIEAIVFAGQDFGYKGPVDTEAPVTYVHFLLKPGARMEYSISTNHNVFVYGLSGSGKCDNTHVVAHEAIAMEKEGDGVLLTAAEDENLEVVVITGEPLNEPKLVAREQSEGAGARVYRSIGPSQLRTLDPFLMLDEASVGLPGGFPAHPHRGFETVSYMLPTSKGNFQHEDFLGNEGELRPGDLQWMTVGRGIMHSEIPKSHDPAHGLQLWVNLPKLRKMIQPATKTSRSVEALVFAGEVFGQRGPIETEAPVTYVHFMLDAGAKLEYPIPSTHNALVYAISGRGQCVGASIQPHEAIVMEKDGDGVVLTAAEKDTLEVIVMTGEPLNEPVVQHGPFVMNSIEGLKQTFEDFQQAKNGFENARSWEPKTQRRR